MYVWRKMQNTNVDYVRKLDIVAMNVRIYIGKYIKNIVIVFGLILTIK
jgi:hypothetical protein